MSGRGRWPAVDGLRAVAALTVLAYHVSLATGLARGTALAPLFAELKAGVCVFFVISGFVLWVPYARALRDGAPLPNWRTFAQRRAVRILPAYWLVLTIAAFALPHAGVLGPNSWRFYLLSQIYDPDTVFSGLGVAWSLCVEVTFYVMLPLLAALLARASRKRGALGTQLAALGLLAGATTVLRIAVCGSPLAAVPQPRLVLMTSLPGFLDWFALGMGLAVLSSALE